MSAKTGSLLIILCVVIIKITTKTAMKKRKSTQWQVLHGNIKEMCHWKRYESTLRLREAHSELRLPSDSLDLSSGTKT
jgi:hypothetical protein